ncbi:MAG TPA: DegV family protein [Anaerolineae bacterium]|nr:DegV family protein [Anaerolineae bacterium]HPL27406.1 DegV family protein [Anaerolineae bacterium]
MQIVSDRGMDLSPEQTRGLEIHLLPLILTLDGRSYKSGVDIQPDQFYQLLANTESYPTTSQPSVGDFVTLYRHLAQRDPDILSIHISSGLSSTVNTARAAAQMVPEANVTIIDSKTLSGAQGWQVEGAARAVRAGWPKERVLALVERISQATDTVFTLRTLRYLIHGGRISHIKGLLGQVLNIKPLIAVEKAGGTYTQVGQARSLERAILKLADHVARQHAPGSALRLQVLHGHNPEGAALLCERLAQLFRCTWLPTGPIAPVLGAHTGPGLVGVAYAPAAAFELP